MAGISCVFTIGYVAELLGQNEDWLEEFSVDMEPEDGRLFIVDTNDETMTAFTKYGIENLKQLILDRKE